MVIEEGHPLYSAFGGIHHICANDKTLEASSADHVIMEGQRKVVGVMHTDAKRFAAAGG